MSKTVMLVKSKKALICSIRCVEVSTIRGPAYCYVRPIEESKKIMLK